MSRTQKRSYIKKWEHVLPQGAIIEMISHGRFIKVSAIDPVSGVETSIVGDNQYSTLLLKNMAVRKLAYVIRRKVSVT